MTSADMNERPIEPVAQILLTLTADGSVNVQFGGPGANKVTLLGLLETAKPLILNPPAQGSPLVLARGSLPGNGNLAR